MKIIDHLADRALFVMLFIIFHVLLFIRITLLKSSVVMSPMYGILFGDLNLLFELDYALL